MKIRKNIIFAICCIFVIAMVCYIAYYKSSETLGGDYNVAISKKDGAIIKIWAGE